jgi:membrane associated rhomboid family serine protease
MIGNTLLYLLLFIVFYFAVRSRYDKERSLMENLYGLKGYISLFLLLLVLSFFYFDMDTLAIKGRVVERFGLKNYSELTNFYPVITSNFIHNDYLHLFANLLFLSFLVVIDEKYGYIFFLLIFFVSSIFSSLALMFILPADGVCLGSSNGLCGLYSVIIAENLIFDKLPVKLSAGGKLLDVLFSLSILLAVIFLLSYGRNYWVSSIYTLVAHVLGAVAGYATYILIKYLIPDFYNLLTRKGKEPLNVRLPS